MTSAKVDAEGGPLAVGDERVAWDSTGPIARLRITDLLPDKGYVQGEVLGVREVGQGYWHEGDTITPEPRKLYSVGAEPDYLQLIGLA